MSKRRYRLPWLSGFGVPKVTRCIQSSSPSSTHSNVLVFHHHRSSRTRIRHWSRFSTISGYRLNTSDRRGLRKLRSSRRGSSRKRSKTLLSGEMFSADSTKTYRERKHWNRRKCSSSVMSSLRTSFTFPTSLRFGTS